MGNRDRCSRRESSMNAEFRSPGEAILHRGGPSRSVRGSPARNRSLAHPAGLSRFSRQKLFKEAGTMPVRPSERPRSGRPIAGSPHSNLMDERSSVKLSPRERGWLAEDVGHPGPPEGVRVRRDSTARAGTVSEGALSAFQGELRPRTSEGRRIAQSATLGRTSVPENPAHDGWHGVPEGIGSVL